MLRRAIWCVAIATAVAMLFSATAWAISDVEALRQFGSQGSGAGQFNVPGGMGSKPGPPGDLYVADQLNHRIVEFSPWGTFVRAWGWGVADGSNEFQICAVQCQTGIAGGG